MRKFYLLDHLVDDLECFGGFQVVSASPYERFSFTVIQVNLNILKCLQTRKKDTDKFLHSTSKWEKVSQSTTPEQPITDI